MTGLLGAALGLVFLGSFNAGWKLMDSHLEKRRAKREASMKNITPTKEK